MIGFYSKLIISVKIKYNYYYTDMSKIITISLDNDKYELFQKFAQMDNREISNFMETTTTRYIEEISYVDEFEMIEINSHQELNDSLNNARNDIKNNRRRIVD